MPVWPRKRCRSMISSRLRFTQFRLSTRRAPSMRMWKKMYSYFCSSSSKGISAMLGDWMSSCVICSRVGG